MQLDTRVQTPLGSVELSSGQALSYTMHENYILAYFPYFEKINLVLRDHHAVCVSGITPLLTFEPIFMKSGVSRLLGPS
jgi:hypothetical protein